MYNVLEKLRAGERIEGKDKEIYDQGLVGILRDLHDQIDTAVADAYGWPADLSDDDILHRLVDLNRERAAEEARGHIRYLRPDYQNPQGTRRRTRANRQHSTSAPRTRPKRPRGPNPCPNRSPPCAPPFPTWAKPPPNRSPANSNGAAQAPCNPFWKA